MRLLIEYFPEPEERTVIVECDICGEPLFEGDTVYKILGKYICEDCIESAEKTIESEEI